MGLPTTLTQAEINELLYAQIQAINAVLCGTVNGFETDMVNVANDEIDSSTLVAASKTKIKAQVVVVKDKYKRK